MNLWLWVLTGLLAAGAVFVFGCLVGGRPVRDLLDHITRQDLVIERLNRYATHLEGRLNRDTLDDELRRLLDGGGAA